MHKQYGINRVSIDCVDTRTYYCFLTFKVTELKITT